MSPPFADRCARGCARISGGKNLVIDRKVVSDEPFDLAGDALGHSRKNLRKVSRRGRAAWWLSVRRSSFRTRWRLIPRS